MISVIIPVFNEADVIAPTIRYLHDHDPENQIVEIIVSDGGSSDNTVDIAVEHGAKIINSSKKGRAPQMNEGGQIARGDILYFLHADTTPPPTFVMDILQASKSSEAGCFTLRFDHEHWFLRANAWFTRFDLNAFRFGDQSLFVTAKVFKQVNGFNENNIILEDQEIIKRLRKRTNFKIIRHPVTTSSRKYLKNGIYRTQLIYFYIYLLYRLGVSQLELLKRYRKLIHQDKL